jgi:cytidylate kinase
MSVLPAPLMEDFKNDLNIIVESPSDTLTLDPLAPPTVIAIDGPAASGKSTISRLVAEALGFHHVDSGSMYRAVTWKVLKEKIDPGDSRAVVELLNRIQLDCDFVEGHEGVLRLRNRVDGEDPGMALRSSEVERHVSAIAAIPEVRRHLVAKQQGLARFGNLVMEGRDIGTVVFPDTPFKFYLEADLEIRAKRRAEDQGVSHSPSGVQSVETSMVERDRLDSSRNTSPLKKADDATCVDTSFSDPQGSADLVLKHIRSIYVKKS